MLVILYLKMEAQSIEAVEKAVIVKLEDSHLFNAGKGSVFTATETHEMDASIMDGKDLKCWGSFFDKLELKILFL